jgi:hypothetical protein
VHVPAVACAGAMPTHLHAIDGGNHVDQLVGGDGNDLIHGYQQADHLSGGKGADAIYGDEGTDALFGQDGNDWLDGGNGTDALYGGTGHDMLFGGNGDDALFGEEGNDCLWGGNGADAFYGGAGNDIFHDIDNADLHGNQPVINGGDGDDIAMMGGLHDFRADNANNDDNYVREIEVLNFDGKKGDAGDNGVGTTIVLDVHSVLDMTDDRNTLFVQGDAQDHLTMQGTWSQDANVHTGDDGRTYIGFTTEVGGQSVHVYVDTDITIAP